MAETSPKATASKAVRSKAWWLGKSEWFSFQELIKREEAWLRIRVDRAAEDQTPTTTASSEPVESNAAAPCDATAPCDETEGMLEIEGDQEPWVSATSKDRFGLALSGGGIRSATFNLGLLQALSRKVDTEGSQPSVLDHVDYVATVSGGGYIGGFWSRWLCHMAQNKLLDRPDQPLFPQPKEQRDGRLTQAEATPIRHLRERSRFLIPRIGLFESETWTAVVTVLGATVPSLLIAASFLVLVSLAWLGLLSLLNLGVAAYIFAALTLFIAVGSEAVSRRRARIPKLSTLPYSSSAVILTGAAAGLWHLLANVDYFETTASSKTECGLIWDFACDQTLLILPPAVWFLLSGSLLLVVRPLLSRLEPHNLRLMERLAARCLAPAVIWIFLAATWWLARTIESETPSGQAEASVLTVTASATGLFIWLRDWLNKPIKETHGSKVLDKALAIAKPIIPQLLAYAVLVGMLWLAARGVWYALHSEGHDTNPILKLAVGALAIILACVLFVDPKRIGLHEFYRSRIAATFLGGYEEEFSLPDPARPGSVVPLATVSDDVSLGDLHSPSKWRRPIHLVCTTANHLSGDALTNLYRGGSSLTLSPIAVSIGDAAIANPKLEFSAALTASAAAFNSQMGSFSKRLGPAVAFIMSALGLRLGLWIKHPIAPVTPVSFPGRYLFEELLSRSNVDPPGADLHLSDGGHFENLALYELVRRHCRYILVSDCGADAEVAFDDLANATRRIREDFGVELELDVEPLRPNGNGLSQQHAVVGTIHYDGLRGDDKGVLVYFKPTLVGDEPTDVMQYRRRNLGFPHESTGDQFYDEAQWESYRRLGEHCGRAFFRYLEDKGLNREGNAVERLFLGAIERWQRLRGAAPERLLDLVRERDELLSDLQKSAPPFLRAELFPEIASPMAVSATLIDAEQMSALHYCIRLTTFMDQVYHVTQLERMWSHASNQVWMTFFGRCCGAHTFRSWWPILRPWCSNGLRDFIKIRFGVRIAEPARKSANNTNAVVTMNLIPAVAANKLTDSYAATQWVARYGKPADTSFLLQYSACLQGVPAGEKDRDLVVGLLVFREEPSQQGATKERTIKWSSPELFVPDALIGSGFVARFLDSLIAYFKTEVERASTPTTIKLRVSIEDEPRVPGTTSKPRRDPAHRQARRDTLHFYKSRGFVQESVGSEVTLDLSNTPLS